MMQPEQKKLLYFVIDGDRVSYRTANVGEAIAKMLPGSLLAVEMWEKGRGSGTGTQNPGATDTSGGTKMERKAMRSDQASSA